jgi:hypothetical protein
VAVLLGLPSSLLLLQFVLKDVAVHLAHPYDQKLPKASLVSLDRLFMYLVAYRRCVGRSSPLHHGFPGGPSEWHHPLPAEVWLHTLLSLPSFFVGSFQVQFALFQRQALERWFELLPSRGCVAHSAGKRMFASCAKRYLLQLDASSRLLDVAALNHCIFTLSIELASGRLPVPPFWLPFLLL